MTPILSVKLKKVKFKSHQQYETKKHTHLLHIECRAQYCFAALKQTTS